MIPLTIGSIHDFDDHRDVNESDAPLVKSIIVFVKCAFAFGMPAESSFEL